MSDGPIFDRKLRMPPVFPSRVITAEMLARFHASLAEQGVPEGSVYIEATVFYPAQYEEQFLKASYAVVGDD